MSTVVSKRRINNFKPLLDAFNLVKYTLEITGNENVFIPKYKALTDDIIHTTEFIFTKAWEANNIRVKDYEDARLRCQLQTEAILKCKNLLSLIDISYNLFHLRGKRVVYWGSLVMDVRDSLIGWRYHEIKKYDLRPLYIKEDFNAT